jgi:hypothetical protein
VNVSRQLVVFVFFLLAILLVGMIFWPFILNEIIAPTSLTVWVLLRIFVLSIDQKYFWVGIILITSFILYRSLLPRIPPPIQTYDFHKPNETMRSIDYWNRLFIVIDKKVQDEKTIKKELAYLLLTLYTPKQRALTGFRLYNALQNGQIPLPENIHTFLFPEELQGSERSIKGLLQSIQKTPMKWIRRWTGQEAAEHYRMIDEVLGFIETYLEIKNEQRKSISNKH